MGASSFSSEAYSVLERNRVWDGELRGFGAVSQILSDDGQLHATMSCQVSATGLRLGLVAASSQQLVFSLEPSLGFWLALLLEGDAAMATRAGRCKLDVGDIVFGMLGDRTRLELPSNFKLLLVKIPGELLSSRLLAPLSVKTGKFSEQCSARNILAAMLLSVGKGIDGLHQNDLRPLDIAIPELFITCAIDNIDRSIVGMASSKVTAPLHRICQTIEGHLGNPELSLAMVAKEHGISQRAVQKLFESVGGQFSSYVKHRRLDRCRSDLTNPRFAHLSVSAIAFRWGFNEAAHFSRTFRQYVGVPPREYRHAVADQGIADRETLKPVRGFPNEAARLQGSVVPFPRALRRGKAQTPAPMRRPAAARPPFSLDPHFDLNARKHHQLPANSKTVHWGYLSRSLSPVLEISSTDVVTIETLTQHASDDCSRMIECDSGAEDVFRWTRGRKGVNRRGAGPMDASIFGRGAGEGFGVHICTGPILVRDAKPGDVLEVRIHNITPRLSANPAFEGRCFGSNAAAWWGFHYNDLITAPEKREVVTVYEVKGPEGARHAQAVYNYRWTPQRDPDGVVHATIDYPGVPVDHATVERNYDVLKGVKIPVRPHFGVIGLAPNNSGVVDSVPPSSFGGNLDNWRLGKGAKLYLPVQVPGAMFSVGDPHASQGDGEICGTAIECSLTGVFQFILQEKGARTDPIVADLDYPVIETETEWVIQGFSHPCYLSELGQNAQSEIYKDSSLDLAMRDAFRKARRFLMTTYRLSEDEAISLMSVGVDFGITQVVNGNWGIHAVIRKDLFGA